ncbi:glycosyltransferase family 2 protein [Macrococcus lamae]|uniref:glycosyltransferase family 2 protein n=1 Tax=Macrococcus lamae TaxID=198484 RepID=UPI001407274A|nr:glycosyltransferase family 2 protein [Macrococcus lamae]
MKNKLLFSIIIPTYNSEEKIRRTVDSVLNQSLEKQFFEVIIIDDHSSDQTFSICNEYSRKFSNVHAFQLKKNSGGASAPRNFGLFKAKGQFVYFLDSDDWIAENILSYIYHHPKLLKSDVIVGKSIKVNEKAKTEYAKFMSIKNRLLKPLTEIPYFLYYLGPTSKFLNRKLLIKHHIRFPEEISFGEDKLFFAELYSHVKNVSTITKECGFIDRTATNDSIVRRTSFLKKRKSDELLFDQVKRLSNLTLKKQLIIRIIEQDLLSNCNSETFLKLSQHDKQQVFNLNCKLISDPDTQLVLNQIDEKYSDAIDALQNDNFDKYCEFFMWLKKDNKVAYFKNGEYYLTNQKNTFSLPFVSSHAMIIDILKDYLLLQIKLNHVKRDEIAGLLIESRTSFEQSILLKEVTCSGDLMTCYVSLQLFNQLPAGFYNFKVQYKEYKNIAVRFGYQKNFVLNDKKAMIYPSIAGNLSMKIELENN